MGEDNCKWYVYKAVHIQNKLKRSYNSKLKKKKSHKQTYWKNMQRIWINIFPKMACRWLIGTWKNTQHQ